MGIFPHHIWVKDSEPNTVSDMFQKFYRKLCSAAKHQCAWVQTHCDIKFTQHAWTAWGMLVRWLTLHSKMSAGLIASLFWMSFCILPWLTKVCSSFYTVAVRIFWFQAAATECFCAFQLLLLVVTAHNLIVLLPVSIYFMSSCRKQLFSAN